MKNLKLITIVVLLQTTAYCTATISVQFEKIPDDSRGPPPQQQQQQNRQNNQGAPSQTQPQFSSSNYQQSYIPPIGSNYNIQPSQYNQNSPNYQIPYSQQNPQSSGGHYTGGQYYQPTSNNPIQYSQPQQQEQQQYQQNRPAASASGQHPFAHPNAIHGEAGKPPSRPASFMSLLLGSMGLHGLTNGIFGRRGPPRPPPKNNNNKQQPHQGQGSQQKPNYLPGTQQNQNQHTQGASTPSHFGNHQVAVQNYAQQQHYQVSQHQQQQQYQPPPPQQHQQQQQYQPPPPQQHQQQQSNYPQTSPSTLSHSLNSLDSVNKPDEYTLPTTQSYYDPPTRHHVHSSNHGQGQSSISSSSHDHYEPQYQSSVSHVISGPSLKYEEPPVTTYVEENNSQIKPYTIIEKPVVHYIEKPVVRFVEKTVVRTVEKPVVRVVEKPVIKYIEKPRRGFLGKQGDPYVADSTSVGDEEGESDGEGEIHVINHHYPSNHAPTQHQTGETEYYSGQDGTYFRKEGDSKSQQSASVKNVEPVEDNAFKQIIQLPKELPAYSGPGYRVVQTHTYGPQVSGEGLKIDSFGVSSVAKKIGESEVESVPVASKRRKNKKTVKVTEQFLN